MIAIAPANFTKKRVTVLTTRVILVRHGESSFNVERRVQGHCDLSSLTEIGCAAARMVGEALAELQFDAAYSSPLQRAKQTANLVVAGLKTAPIAPLQTHENLKEISLPPWEGLLFSDVEAQYPEEFRLWREAPHELGMMVDGAKFYPVPTLYDRAREFWQEILPRHANQTILIVAHSGINRGLISTAIGLECDRYQALQQSNCGISVLNFAGGFGDPVQLESLNQTAHLKEAMPAIRKEQTTARLLLVRHGETDWNREKRFQGQIDVPLNPMGEVQAQQVADFLKPIVIDAAVSSPLLRPKATAEAILQQHPAMPLTLVDDLKEISHGLWEGKLEAEIEAEFPGELAEWQRSPATVQMPDGENLQQVWQRAIAAWNQIVQTARDRGENSTTLVVAHDAVNKAILCAVLGLGAEHFWTFKQGNGAVSVIDYALEPNLPTVLQASNITAHLAGGVLDKTAAGAL
jgi:probable phosphoglycerate mutase